MKIYVVGSSKNKFLPLDDIREKFLIDEKHEGDNIDFLNPWYCELTGLYYLWKHVDDDIVGLEHYRTYFWSDKANRPMNEEEIKENLKNGDIIVSGYSYPIPWGVRATRLEQELNACVKGVLPKFLDNMEKHDKGFTDYFRKFLKGQRLYACNCFIGSKKFLDEWAEFIFNLLLDFEQISPIGPNTNTLRREGFFTEFMLGAWIEYKGYKPVIKNIKKWDKEYRFVAQNMRGPDIRL